MKRFSILFVKNTLKDISVFEFEECKILNVQSEKFQQFLSLTSSHNEEYYLNMIEEISIENEEIYAIMGKDYSKPYVQSVYEM